VAKNFKLAPEQIRRLVPFMGRCIASDLITVEGRLVGYMYREVPRDENDSGWSFLAGTEVEDYMSVATNFEIYEVNTICNYDPAVIPYLKEEPGFAFVRKTGTAQFDRVALRPE